MEKSIYDEDCDETSEKNNDEVELKREISIYEIDDTLASNNSNNYNTNNDQQDNELTDQSYSYSSQDNKLCFIGKDVDELPTDLIYQFGLKTRILDISFNNLTDIAELNQFPYLEELICDNNLLTEESKYPELHNLKLLSCNKNRIKNIHIFIDKVKALFPSLTYLSLLGNEACPNELIDENKDEYDYAKYRKYVIHRLPSLKFLDCYEITQTEREQVTKNSSVFYDTISYKHEQTLFNESQNIPNFTPLKEETSPMKQTEFGVCKYTYYGKQSEGNRFIRNDDL